jgi:hypothetical protein
MSEGRWNWWLNTGLLRRTEKHSCNIEASGGLKGKKHDKHQQKPPLPTVPWQHRQFLSYRQAAQWRRCSLIIYHKGGYDIQ